MSLTSNSTDAVVEAAIDDNADYDLENSATKAKDFIQACRIWLRRSLKRAVHGGRGAGNEWERDTNQVQQMLAKAESWLAGTPTESGGTGGGAVVTHADLSLREW